MKIEAARGTADGRGETSRVGDSSGRSLLGHAWRQRLDQQLHQGLDRAADVYPLRILKPLKLDAIHGSHHQNSEHFGIDVPADPAIADTSTNDLIHDRPVVPRSLDEVLMAGVIGIQRLGHQYRGEPGQVGEVGVRFKDATPIARPRKISGPEGW